MTEIPHFSYDEIPYPSLSYSQTHPDRLATLAHLLGMEPAPVETCRLLALGCAGGGNIIPMAYALPNSEFVGIDISERQIEHGQEVISALTLENIQLEARDITTITSEYGEFDYIIAHGVYSWTPPDVRDHLLRVCKENLAPNGVAYVSYNTFPGWHMMSIIRDAMLYHTRTINEPNERATQARAMIDFLAEFVSTENEPYGNFLTSYVEFLRDELKGRAGRGDAFLLHDELETINEPIYFHQFVEHAEEHNLQYLVEAEFPSVFPENFSPEVRQALSQVADDLIEVEQYMDFLRNRMFRQTLLCHDTIDVQRSLSPERVRDLYIASWADPVSDEPNIRGDTVEQFRSPDGAVLSTDHPVSKAAVVYLNEIYPRAVPFDDLLTAARERVDARKEDLPQDAYVLAANMLRAFGYSTQLAELHSFVPAALAPEPGERPTASTIARIQARDDVFVTTLWHQRLRLDDFERSLIQLLDGAHDEPALVAEMMALVEQGVLSVQKEDGTLNSEQIRDFLEDEVARNVRTLAQAAVLVE